MLRRLRRATRPLRHGLLFVALQAFAGALRLLPLDVSLAVGALLGRVVGVAARADRRRMRAFLTRVPAPPSVGACFADLGRRVAELVNARRMGGRCEVDPAALAAWQQAHAQGRGVLIATAHLGHWELMAAALAARGVPFVAVGARPQGGPLFGWLARLRAGLGVAVLAPGGGARTARQVLQAGGTVALFVDQATREKSRPVPFLGAPAPVPRTLERLQAATGAPLMFVWSLRGSDGRYRIEAAALPTLEAVTAHLEALVKAHPAQWIGLHDRWRPRERARLKSSKSERFLSTRP